MPNTYDLHKVDRAACGGAERSAGGSQLSAKSQSNFEFEGIIQAEKQQTKQQRQPTQQQHNSIHTIAIAL